MIVTVFRSRLKPGIRDEYVALAQRMNELAQTLPGYISHKGFFADDGERVTIVEFANEEGMRAWRTNPEHMAAQKLARQKFYSEYYIQVCTVDRESKFKSADSAKAAAAAGLVSLGAALGHAARRYSQHGDAAGHLASALKT